MVGGGEVEENFLALKINLSLGARPLHSAIARLFFALCWRKIPSLWMVCWKLVQILPVPSVGSIVCWLSALMMAIVVEFRLGLLFNVGKVYGV